MQFFETTFFLDPGLARGDGDEPWGIQVLASPPEVHGTRVDYLPL